MTNISVATEIKDVLVEIGRKYIERVEQTAIPNGVNDSNLAWLHEITTFTNLLKPTPGNLNIIFANQPNFPPDRVAEQIRDLVRSSTVKVKLQESLNELSIARLANDETLFRKAAEYFFGVVLVWSVRHEYLLAINGDELSEEGVFSLIEKVGRNERELQVNGEWIPGPVFSAGYLLRFHLKKDVSDLFYFWAAIYPRLKVEYGNDLNHLPSFLTRKLYDFLVYGIEQGVGKMEGVAQNFLPALTEIFGSVERHFPFHENLTAKNFGKLGVIREQYKAFGNTQMIDRVNKLRLVNLSKHSALTPSLVERLLLRFWGALTDWGTSARRVIFIGFIVFFSLLVSSIGSSQEKLERNPVFASKPIKEKAVESVIEASEIFVSYFTAKHDVHFETKSLDMFFSTLIFIYYSVLVGAILTFMLRHI